MNYNKVILGGRLTATPVLKNLPSGDPVCNFRIAVNRTWKDAKTGAKREDSCFIDVAVFGKRAAVVSEYFDKGSNILLEGRIRHEVWEDKQSGETRSRHTIVADNFEFVDPAPPRAADAREATDETPALAAAAAVTAAAAASASGAAPGESGSAVARRNRERSLAAAGAVPGGSVSDDVPF